MTSDAKIGLVLGIVFVIVIFSVKNANTDLQEGDYTWYSNWRFGFRLKYPANWIADPPPENGDGSTFRDPDNPAVYISAAGCLNVGDGDAYMQIEHIEMWNNDAPGYLLISKEISQRPLWQTHQNDPEKDQKVGQIAAYKVVEAFEDERRPLTRITLAVEQDIEVYFLICQAPSQLYSRYGNVFSRACDSFRISKAEISQLRRSEQSLASAWNKLH